MKTNTFFVYTCSVLLYVVGCGQPAALDAPDESALGQSEQEARCKNNGNSCTSGSTCCSTICSIPSGGSSGVCAACVASGSTCNSTSPCCSGLECSTFPGNTNGTCATNVANGALCQRTSQCNDPSSACAASPLYALTSSPAPVCQQVPSTCTSNGQVCNSSIDCCGGSYCYNDVSQGSGVFTCQAPPTTPLGIGKVCYVFGDCQAGLYCYKNVVSPDLTYPGICMPN